MKSKTILAAAALLGAPAFAQTTLYDTFNEDDQANLFDCCNTIALPDQSVRVAIPFTAPANGRVLEIDLALSKESGFYQYFDVRLMGSSGGLPGRIKHKFEAEPIPPGGQCCSFVPVHVRQGTRGIQIHGGDVYWVEVNAHGNVGGWNLNTLALEGAYATGTGKHGQWQATSGPLPAIRVIGK